MEELTDILKMNKPCFDGPHNSFCYKWMLRIPKFISILVSKYNIEDNSDISYSLRAVFDILEYKAANQKALLCSSPRYRSKSTADADILPRRLDCSSFRFIFIKICL